jgi:hypothetical protein
MEIKTIFTIDVQSHTYYKLVNQPTTEDFCIFKDDYNNFSSIVGIIFRTAFLTNDMLAHLPGNEPKVDFFLFNAITFNYEV